jgi:hypothetical protein
MIPCNVDSCSLVRFVYLAVIFSPLLQSLLPSPSAELATFAVSVVVAKIAVGR